MRGKTPQSSIYWTWKRIFEMEMHHTSYVIPAGTKKIFTANSAHIFLREDSGLVHEASRQAVTRRYRVMHICAALYSQ